MKRYMPVGPSKHGEAVMLVLTLGAFTGMRLMGYYAWIGEKNRNAQKPGKEPVAEEMRDPRIPAGFVGHPGNAARTN